MPDGFPRLTDYVTNYALLDTDNGNNRKFMLYWNVMPFSEAEEIVNKVCAWLGDGARYIFDEYEPGKFRWRLSNYEYRFTIIYGLNDDNYVLRIEGFPLSKEFDPQLRFYSPASGINKTVIRNIGWGSMNIDKDFPKLADYVYSYEERDSGIFLNWNDMTFSETEYIVQKIADSFQGEYQIHCEMREIDYFWTFRGEIGGKFRTITISFDRRNGSATDDIPHYVTVKIL